jgi:hypothetical protein
VAAISRLRDYGPDQRSYDSDTADPRLGKITSNLRKAFPLPPDDITIDERFKALLEAMKRTAG